MRIFINIASYRDPFLLETIKDCYNKAKYPINVYIGILDQAFEHEKLDFESLEFKDNIRYTKLEPVYARGLGYARHVVQTFWQGEEYYLQIDAHTLFEQDWDINLITQFIELKCYHEKPVITGYPHMFTITDDISKTIEKTKCQGVMCLAPNIEHAFLSGKLVSGISYIPVDSTTFKHGFFIAGGFMFTLGSVVEQVPYDPNYYFSGEQESMSIRLFTNGYDIFHTADLPLYHYYGTKNRHTPWSDEQNDIVKHYNKWYEAEANSRNRFEKLLSGDDLGVYSLGTEKTLNDYINISGINYFSKTLVYTNHQEIPVFSLDYKEKIDTILA